jgi:hypothetical protein
VKTPRRPDAPKKRRSHFRYGAFLFSVKVIRTTFSFFKMTESEFSHSLAFCWAQLEDTAPRRTGYSGLEFRVYAAKRGSWPEPPEGGTPNGGIVEMRRVLFSSEILPSISYFSVFGF